MLSSIISYQSLVGFVTVDLPCLVIAFIGVSLVVYPVYYAFGWAYFYLLHKRAEWEAKLQYRDACQIARDRRLALVALKTREVDWL